MKASFSALSVTLLVAQVSASAISGRGNFVQSLQTRQTSLDPNSIPAQCDDDCVPVITSLQDCGPDTSCSCVNAINTGYSSCLTCVSDAGALSADMQQGYASYQEQCLAAGIPVSTLPISSAVETTSPYGSASVSSSATTDGASKSASTYAPPTPSGSSSHSTSPTPAPSASRSVSSSGGSASASRSSSSATPSRSANSNGAAPTINGVAGSILAGVGSLFVLLGF